MIIVKWRNLVESQIRNAPKGVRSLLRIADGRSKDQSRNRTRRDPCVTVLSVSTKNDGNNIRSDVCVNVKFETLEGCCYLIVVVGWGDTRDKSMRYVCEAAFSSLRCRQKVYNTTAEKRRKNRRRVDGTTAFGLNSLWANSFPLRNSQSRLIGGRGDNGKLFIRKNATKLRESRNEHSQCTPRTPAHWRRRWLLSSLCCNDDDSNHSSSSTTRKRRGAPLLASEALHLPLLLDYIGAKMPTRKTRTAFSLPQAPRWNGRKTLYTLNYVPGFLCARS